MLATMKLKDVKCLHWECKVCADAVVVFATAHDDDNDVDSDDNADADDADVNELDAADENSNAAAAASVYITLGCSYQWW